MIISFPRQNLTNFKPPRFIVHYYNLIEIIARLLSPNGQNNKIESIERRKTMTPVQRYTW